MMQNLKSCNNLKCHNLLCHNLQYHNLLCHNQWLPRWKSTQRFRKPGSCVQDRHCSGQFDTDTSRTCKAC